MAAADDDIITRWHADRAMFDTLRFTLSQLERATITHTVPTAGSITTSSVVALHICLLVDTLPVAELADTRVSTRRLTPQLFRYAGLLMELYLLRAPAAPQPFITDEQRTTLAHCFTQLRGLAERTPRRAAQARSA